MATMATATSSYNRMKEVKEFDESKIGVKGLSDLGITSIPRFFIQPPETLSDLKSSSTFTNIPIIDLAEPGSFDEAIKGCTGVFHVATPMDFESKDPDP
ncbi:hypothetical protein CIPAW_04G009800 [Carya illinoinensis]|uniref:3-beta hydroxysteroid dehydrogenase/isomerase domain-containing protein n=1 Tax=Carya illinoinensis TaxID=32201 RepID=A0A8T1QPV2_CARIL|nr:hypothetical protein CIPAW_04G009800 [Carya illinoinensis]